MTTNDNFIYRNQQFCFGMQPEKGKRYQDEHSMQYEHDLIIIITVILYNINSTLIKSCKKAFHGFLLSFLFLREVFLKLDIKLYLPIIFFVVEHE